MKTWKDSHLMCVGYFNTHLYPLEKKGGLGDISKSMQDLEGFLSGNDLMDIELQGVQFTLSNNRMGKILFR